MTNWQAYKQLADLWYKQYETTHRTQQAIERGKEFNEKFGKVVRE